MLNVRWGIFGARGDRRGLAIQSEEIARNLRPDRVLGVDMGDKSPLEPDWSGYDRARLTVRHIDPLRADFADFTPADAAEWMDGLDVVFGCETFYAPWLTGVAKAAGVATVLQANPEFVGHVWDWEPVPTRVVTPTKWLADRMRGAAVLPVGVARDRLRFRPRVGLGVLLHIAGHGAMHDRNGTVALMDALRFVRKPVAVVVRAQRRTNVPTQRLPRWVDVEVRQADESDYAALYDEGDVMVLPRRYGGLCLPAQEALSTGMPVLMPDCAPNPDLLPPAMLVPLAPPRPGRNFQTQAGRVELADADPALLAFRIDHLSAHPEEVQALSIEADSVAAGLAWPAVAGRYEETLREAATAVASGA